MKRRHNRSLLVLVFASAVAVAACGGKKDGGGGKAPPKPADGTPLTFQFVKMDGEGKRMAAELKVFNHADKDVRGTQLRLHYMDGAGKELKTFPWGAVKQPSLVAKGKWATMKAGAFMPPETKSVKVTVRRVEYADGTKWNAPDAAKPPTPAPAKPAADTPPAAKAEPDNKAE